MGGDHFMVQEQESASLRSHRLTTAPQSPEEETDDEVDSASSASSSSLGGGARKRDYEGFQPPGQHEPQHKTICLCDTQPCRHCNKKIKLSARQRKRQLERNFGTDFKPGTIRHRLNYLQNSFGDQLQLIEESLPKAFYRDMSMERFIKARIELNGHHTAANEAWKISVQRRSATMEEVPVDIHRNSKVQVVTSFSPNQVPHFEQEKDEESSETKTEAISEPTKVVETPSQPMVPPPQEEQDDVTLTTETMQVDEQISSLEPQVEANPEFLEMEPAENVSTAVVEESPEDVIMQVDQETTPAVPQQEQEPVKQAQDPATEIPVAMDEDIATPEEPAATATPMEEEPIKAMPKTAEIKSEEKKEEVVAPKPSDEPVPKDGEPSKARQTQDGVSSDGTPSTKLEKENAAVSSPNSVLQGGVFAGDQPRPLEAKKKSKKLVPLKENRKIRFADEHGGELTKEHVIHREANYASRIVVMLLSPKDRKFEFLHAEYPLDESTTVQVLLEQVPSLATNDAFRSKKFNALLQTETSRELDNKLALQDYKFKESEIVLGIPDDFTVANMTKMAVPLLLNKKLMKTVKQAIRKGRGLKTVKSGEEWNASADDE